MSKIPSILEQELKGLKPSGLDDAFLARLTACADESFAELTAEEMAFEKGLKNIAPRGAQNSLQTKLLAAIGDAPFAVDEKIVLFNKSSQRPAQNTDRKRGKILRFNFAAAAAVALLGGITALMLPNNQAPASNSTVAATPDADAIATIVPPRAASNLAPASFNRNLDETSDEGVIWRNNTQPYRVYRQSYTDRVTSENEDGKIIEMEQPHIEHILIPEIID